MGWLVRALDCIAIAGGFALAEEMPHWKNRVGISKGTSVRYQRELGWGFWVGPSSGYELDWNMTERGNIHLDQRPEFTLVNLTHEAYWRSLGLENNFHWLGQGFNWQDFTFTSVLELRLPAGRRMSVNPRIEWLRFEYFPESYAWTDEVSEYRLGADMAVELELEIRF